MYRNWTKEQRRDFAIAAMKSVPSEQELSSSSDEEMARGDTMPDVNDNMSDTDCEKTLTEPNDTSLTLFDGNGFIGINRPSVGIYVQRNRPQMATDSPLSGYEEVILDLCDHIRILERKAAEAQQSSPTLPPKRNKSNDQWDAGIDSFAPMNEGIRYIPACEVTKAQREQAQNSELHKQGDMILIWVNEGDLYRMILKELKS